MSHDSITIHDVRRITGQPDHVINHAVKRFGPKPTHRLGTMRVWDGPQLEEIKRSIERTTRARREASGD